MPSFCRHNRLESTCPVCSRKKAAADGSASRPKAPRRQSARSATQRSAVSRTRRRAADSDLSVRRLARAPDDGFESDLAPGLRSSADALLLAEELAFAAARLHELRERPAGILGEARELARDGRVEEGLWLLAQVAAYGLREPWQQSGEASVEPDAALRPVLVPWQSDERPVLDPQLRGPRASSDPAATLSAYRAWAARSGGQAAALAGDGAWDPARRFDRAFERLALPGFARGPRYDFLVVAGALGLADLEPAQLHLLADPRDPVLAAAKRVFGFGDPIVVARRARELAAATALPIAALDLGLLNWSRISDDPGAGRISAGTKVAADPGARALVIGALGVVEPDRA